MDIETQTALTKKANRERVAREQGFTTFAGQKAGTFAEFIDRLDVTVTEVVGWHQDPERGRQADVKRVKLGPDYVSGYAFRTDGFDRKYVVLVTLDGQKHKWGLDGAPFDPDTMDGRPKPKPERATRPPARG